MNIKVIYFIITFTIITIFGLVGLLIFSLSNKSDANVNSDLVLGTKEFNIKDIEKNDNIKSCWTIINGTVYDATKVIANNPNLQDILITACGKDGSDIYVIKKYGSQALSDKDIKMLYSQLQDHRLGIIAPTTAE
jgi:cytochrome b involved in lipid metabolism